ncbi:unnamed protein product (mitochondrion) [Plasmodiophora brassicae]|uniref:DUF3730 domain-containing protein n=1 Tax=Plasmodiophora brassicae TaxID=37360 RepID=A0A3P3Y3U5_PLABS|nr:unnamed protein product [Plasmodiophora brassicae]
MTMSAAEIVGRVEAAQPRCTCLQGESLVQGLLGAISDAPRTRAVHNLAVALVDVVVVLVDDTSPVTASALTRALSIRPDCFPSILSGIRNYVRTPSRHVGRLVPFVKDLFKTDKLSSLWLPLHSTLLAISRQRPALSLEIITLLVDIRAIHLSGAFPNTHNGYWHTFREDSLGDLIDALFDVDVGAHGLPKCLNLAWRIVGLSLEGLTFGGLHGIPSEGHVRSLSYLFSLDPLLATDPRVLAILAWNLHFHEGVLTAHDQCAMLDLIALVIDSISAFPHKRTTCQVAAAIALLRPRLLEMLSSTAVSTVAVDVLRRADELVVSISDTEETMISYDSESLPSVLDVWKFPGITDALAVFQVLSSQPRTSSCIRNVTAIEGSDWRNVKLFISATIDSGNPDDLGIARNYFQLLARDHGDQALTILPAILHRLRDDQNECTRLELLLFLPMLARQPQGLSRALRVILPLGNHPNTSLQALCVHLLTSLCVVEPRSFSRLHEFLLRMHTSESRVIRAAVAASVSTVCSHSGDNALQLVPLLQQLLEDSDPVIVALALESIRTLCLSFFLDFGVVYGVLEKRRIRQFCVGRNPTALRKLCSLLECSQLVDHESDEDNEFQRPILHYLWDLSHPRLSPHVEVRISACQVLSRFVRQAIASDAFTNSEAAEFFLDRSFTLGVVERLEQEPSGRVRKALETLSGLACNLQLVRSSSTVTDIKVKRADDIVGDVPNNCSWIIRSARSDLSEMAHVPDSRPCLRDALSACAIAYLSDRPSTASNTADCLDKAALAQSVFIPTMCYAWRRYAGRIVTGLVADSASAPTTHLAALERIEKQLLDLDIGDSRRRGNALLCLAGLAIRASSWGYMDVTERIHLHILNAAEASDVSLKTVQAPALLALSMTAAALHPTDCVRRQQAFDILLSKHRSTQSGTASAAVIGIGIFCDGLVQSGLDDSNSSSISSDRVNLIECSANVLYTGAFESSATSEEVGYSIVAPCAVGLAWVISAGARAGMDQFLLDLHTKLLDRISSDNMYECRNASFWCIGDLSIRLFSKGVIGADLLHDVVSLHVAELSKANPCAAACVAIGALTNALHCSSYNFALLPGGFVQEIASRLLHLLERHSTGNAAASTTGCTVSQGCLLGIASLLGANPINPFEGNLSPSLQTFESLFHDNGVSFYDALVSLAKSGKDPSVVETAVFTLGMLSSLAFPKERSSRDAKRGAPPGSLLYILCDSVQSRSMGNRQLASVTRALLQASLGKPQIRLPIAAAAFTRIVKVLHNNASLDELVLQVPALELLLQQAKADDALKNVVLAMVKPFSSHPHLNCFMHFLSWLSVPDHRVKSAAIQTLASDELAKLIIAAGASSQSSRLYASCFEIVGINEIDSALPVTNEFTPVNLAGIFVRCELDLWRGKTLLVGSCLFLPKRALKPSPRLNGCLGF